jgi:hypothetical protein
MRRPVSGSGRLAPLDGGRSRRSGVMRLCSSKQPAHISLIRRRSRPIVSRAPASSGIYLRFARRSTVNIDQEIEGAATNRLTAGPSISAIWMVNARWYTEKSDHICKEAGAKTDAIGLKPLGSKGEGLASEQILCQALQPSVWAINPFRLNERLTLQRGVFLCPGDPTQSFEDNLVALPGYDRESNLVRFRIPASSIGQVRALLDNLTAGALALGLTTGRTRSA